jgi:predicted TIM-barrel fold metal-dependent hydrolase
MTYAGDRVMLDADSHVMELPDFLTAHADPAMRDAIPPVSFDSGGKLGTRLATYSEQRRHTDDVLAEQLGLGDRLLTGAKGYEAVGAFDRAERAKALDLLGFEKQFVFATFSPGVVFDARLAPDVAAAAARAHNRAMAEFCADEPRMIGVATTSLDDVDAAVAEVDHIVELGLGAVWVPHRAPGGRSPGHDDLDRFWARVAAAGIPVVLHVGGHPLQLDQAFMNTGRPVPGDWLGGGENVRGKDMIGLHHAAELFVGTMVLDGVLERHRDLRLGVVELGAGWVPAMLRRLDQVAGIWSRSEPDLKALTRPPSQQLTEQAAFTPYPFEDVGAMVRDSNPDLYLFSSDYPHIEGGRDPLGRFETSLDGFSDAVMAKFLAGNMRRLLEPAA